MSQLSSIIKSHQTVCWYPSAGADLNAINYWNKGIGNILEPTLYIFTDTAYLINDENLNFYKYDNNLLEIPNEFIVSKRKQQIELPNCRNEDERIKDWKNNYIEANYSKIINGDGPNWENTKGLIELGITNLEQFYPDLDCYIKSNYKTLINDENLIKLYEKGKADINLIYQCLDDYSVNTSSYHHLKKENIEIILLNAFNEDFYCFCVNNSLNIDCIILQRYFQDGYVFDGRSESKVVNTLNVKEGIVNPSYSSCPIESLIISNLFWENFNYPNSDVVAYARYK